MWLISLSSPLVFITFLSTLTVVSGEIILSEYEQIALESSSDLLPSSKQARRVGQHLQEIRRQYSVVSQVYHDQKWAPGELIAPWIELNRDFGRNIKAINSSEYGPISSRDATFPDLIFQFSRPYNPEELGKIVEAKFGYKTFPNFNTKTPKNEISVSLESKVGIYSIKKSWKIEEQTFAHYWVFKVTTDDDDSSFIVSLVKQYGDKFQELEFTKM